MTRRATNSSPTRSRPVWCPGTNLAKSGDRALVYEYKGREIKFCCEDCLKDLDKDPGKGSEKFDGRSQGQTRHWPTR